MLSFQSSNYWTFPCEKNLRIKFKNFGFYVPRPELITSGSSSSCIRWQVRLVSGYLFHYIHGKSEHEAMVAREKRIKASLLFRLRGQFFLVHLQDSDGSKSGMNWRYQEGMKTLTVCMSVGLIVTRISWRTKDKGVQSTATWQLSNRSDAIKR